jgi:tetratricopeptide (TPR) repeat protein
MGFCFSNVSLAEESHPGLEAESLYSEAVLAYNRKQTQEAVEILDQLLKQQPDHIQGLELKALSLKTAGNDVESLETYEHLLQLKPESERGPYYFEAALLYNKFKKIDQARNAFKKSIELNFNRVASELFLGILEFNDGKFYDAESNFKILRDEGTPEYVVVAHYYLGMIYFKRSYAPGGTSEMITAKSQATALPDSKMASDIKTAAEKVLQPFSSSRVFANLTLMMDYDSNVAENPNVSSAETAASNASTTKASLSGGLGFMSSPLAKIQYVPSYRFSYNYNFNADTKEYSFFTNTGSLFMNYNALGETTGGIKLEGNFTFQDQPVDSTNPSGSYVYQKYSVGGDLGVFVKTRFKEKFAVNWDLDYKPQTYYISSYLSGGDYSTKVSVNYESQSNYFRPGIVAALEKNQAQSDDWKFMQESLGIYNPIRITGNDTVTLGADIALINYPVSSAGRSDTNLILHANWIKLLGRGWTFLGELSYTDNSSNIPETYSYNRLIAGLGISKSW